MSLSELTKILRFGAILNERECHDAVQALLSSEIPNTQKADFLLAQMGRDLQEDELVGFSRAILPLARSPHSSCVRKWNGKDIMDCCGTGGGGLNLLNVSTGIVFILAAAGVPVVKHGNRGITKKSGSADVLEALGLKIDLAPAELEESLQELGWGFVFAPHYHPSFKALGPVRQQLGAQGHKTIFNFLGPLLNPVRPNAQLVGVFQEKLLGIYHRTLIRLGCAKPCVVFGRHTDGTPLGEVGIGGDNVFSDPQFNFSAPSPIPGKLDSVLVKDAEESAYRLEQILSNQEIGLGRELLVENAAIALHLQGRCLDRPESLALANEILNQGLAKELLRKSRQWAHSKK